MPRIKALTTGTIPNFLDAILNIAESDTSSSLDFHDNWVYQFKNNGNKTIHFFGDDTWIRLFPGLFDKTDGTTSFFVSVRCSELLQFKFYILIFLGIRIRLRLI